jgi:hypothetical protein
VQLRGEVAVSFCFVLDLAEWVGAQVGVVSARGDLPGDLDVGLVRADHEPVARFFLSNDRKVFFGAGMWDNWAAFAAGNPSYRVAKNDVPFIIADVEGDYHVYDFQFG